jgi:hypothetical protein
MRAATDGQGFLTRLQRERCASDWTQQEAIDRLKRLAHERGYGQRFDGLKVSTLSRYEHGSIHRPQAALPALFAALYQALAEALFPATLWPHNHENGPVGRTLTLLSAVGGAAALSGRSGPDGLLPNVAELGLVVEQMAVGAARACRAAFVRTLASGDDDRSQLWRRPVLGTVPPWRIGVRRAEPFLVLDVGEFTARCRSCPWISPPAATVAEVRAWFAGHACEQAPTWPALLRLRLAAVELATARVRRCLICARVGLRRFRPARPGMPPAWVRTWVCADRPGCQQRSAAAEARRQRRWRRRRFA